MMGTVQNAITDYGGETTHCDQSYMVYYFKVAMAQIKSPTVTELNEKL